MPPIVSETFLGAQLCQNPSVSQFGRPLFLTSMEGDEASWPRPPRPRGLGYDPERDVFPSTVYSSVEGVPLVYEYERPGRRRHDPDEVRRRRDVQGRFGVDGDSFSGGWSARHGSARERGVRHHRDAREELTVTPRRRDSLSRRATRRWTWGFSLLGAAGSVRGETRAAASRHRGSWRPRPSPSRRLSRRGAPVGRSSAARPC